MDLARLQQKHAAGSAAVLNASAIELLNPLLGDPHQIAVVPVRVIGMALKMGTQGFDAGFIVLSQIDPVVSSHGGYPYQYSPSFITCGAGRV